MAKRKIIKIDEKKCNGCGECIPNCKEDAIQIVNNKARLVSEVFCDGLGACLGACPQGAITIEEREAEAFDEEKVKAHISGHCACPGSKIMDFRKSETAHEGACVAEARSELQQWPIQIMLVPAHAPYLENANLLIAADCVPFAYANFHHDLLKGKILLVGCPKLDDLEAYKEKFKQIFKLNQIKSITYAHMEVPCCSGLIGVIKEAIKGSAKNVVFEEAIISIQGERVK
ncbi:MAG: 4Fe-4S binding protein [Candidatus Omnitrophica bacterium]|nr:4Fe-4S binding protein [Candidatus Omnitrophota bacterium]